MAMNQDEFLRLTELPWATMTLQRLPPSRPTTPSQKDESPTEKSLDLRVLAEESEWAEYILYGPNKEKLAVHTELFRKKEKIIDGQKNIFPRLQRLV
mmetsp:Transcript_499/g.662  ORF Transcript_499/g.662 Transcript_499/m.662 type:complete len:97 (+) Transcript_499:69-359(+)